MDYSKRHHMRRGKECLVPAHDVRKPYFHIGFPKTVLSYDGSYGAEFGYSRRGTEARQKPAWCGIAPLHRRPSPTRWFRAVMSLNKHISLSVIRTCSSRNLIFNLQLLLCRYARCQ